MTHRRPAPHDDPACRRAQRHVAAIRAATDVRCAHAQREKGTAMTEENFAAEVLGTSVDGERIVRRPDVIPGLYSYEVVAGGAHRVLLIDEQVPSGGARVTLSAAAPGSRHDTKGIALDAPLAYRHAREVLWALALI